MLQDIRDKTQGWKTRAIFALVCVAFILWGGHSFMTWAGSSGSGIAKVDGEEITPAQFNQAYQRLVQERQGQLGAAFKMTDKEQAELKQAALQQLIASTAMVKAAEKKDLRFTPNQVGRVIAGISAFQQDGRFSPTKFSQTLANMGFSENDFFNDIRNAMLINQLRVGIVGSSFALPGEVNQALQLVNQKRDLAFAVLSAKSFANKATVSDDQVKAYYAQHQDQFTTPQTVTVQYLELALPDLAKKMAISDEELRKFYEANVDSYSIPAQWQLATIYLPANDDKANATLSKMADELKHGQKLDAVAKEDPNAKAQMSSWVNAKSIAPSIAKVLQTMKVGDVSAPIAAGEGLIVIKVVNAKPAKVQAFEQVKAAVRQALAAQKAGQVFADTSDKLSNLTYTNPQSLDPAAKELGLTVQTSEPLVAKVPAKGIFANDAVKAAVFSSDVLAGNNSNMINLDEQHVAVVRVFKQQPSQVKTLAQVHDQIVAILKAQQIQGLLSSAAEGMVSQVMTGKSLTEVARAQGLAVTQQTNVSRYTSGASGAIYNAGFQLPRPGKTPAVGMFQLPSGDYAVVQVLKASADNDSKIQPIQQRVMEQQIERGYAQLDYQLYATGVLSAANIHVNNNAIKNS